MYRHMGWFQAHVDCTFVLYHFDISRKEVGILFAIEHLLDKKHFIKDHYNQFVYINLVSIQTLILINIWENDFIPLGYVNSHIKCEVLQAVHISLENCLDHMGIYQLKFKGNW